jgi:hypothetical protein
MQKIAVATLIVMATASSGAIAQEAQPYAGLQARTIKALSDEQIADLRAGRGMGMALAAELNGYPGPRHAIELAVPLGLSPSQLAEVERLFEAMRAETVGLGEVLIQEEAELDRAFAGRTISPGDIDALTAAAGRAEAAVRAAHLKAHLATLAALTPEQARRYAELRGYATPAGPQHGHGGHAGAH